MPANTEFADAYAKALNDIADGKTGSEAADFFNQAHDFAHGWIGDHDGAPRIGLLYEEQARAEWGLGEKGAAKQSIDTAVEKMPTEYDALVWQGIIWRDMSPGDKNAVGSSVPVFEQAISVRNETRTAWAHYELAVAYSMIRDSDRAIGELDQATAQWPDRALRDKIEKLRHDLESGGKNGH